MVGRCPKSGLELGFDGAFVESGVSGGDRFACSPGCSDVVRRLVPLMSTAYIPHPPLRRLHAVYVKQRFAPGRGCLLSN
jgi:hypothetical protein